MTAPNHITPSDRVAAKAFADRGSASLTSRRYTVGDCTVLAVAGDIDESSAAAFRDELEAAAAEHASGRVVVDLAGVTFFGCSGIGELIQAVRRTGWSPGSVCLCGASESVRRVLDVTRVYTVCPVYDSLDLAVGARS
jgi:stage II sporulation protein AA (anti-sigma F factor antagonist)